MLKINLLGVANLHSFRFSVPVVCEIAGFSERTFFSRVKSGKIKPSHDEQNRIRDGRPRIYVTGDVLADYLRCADEATARERLGLPAIVEDEPEPEPFDRKIFARPLDQRERETQVPDVGRPCDAVNGFTDDPAQNLELWNSGEITDSAGNDGQGRNDRFPTKGPQTLLGPQAPKERVKADSTVHMDPALIGDLTALPNPVDSDAFNELWHPGTADKKAQMYAQCGVRPLSQQQQKEYNDRLALHAAFRWSR
jgi:hypothetical protein